MGGFPDYLRMILGWWSGGDSTPEVVKRYGKTVLRVAGKGRDYFPIGEAFIVEFGGLKEVGGDYDNTLELFITIRNEAEQDLITPFEMTPTGFRGVFLATMPGSLPLVDGSQYRLVVYSANGAVYRDLEQYAQLHGAK